MPNLDDRDLIRQILAGRQELFRSLVMRYQLPLFRFLGSFRLSGARVEELAQETFVRAYRNLASYDPARGATFASWLFTIARNLALNELGRSEHGHSAELPEQPPQPEQDEMRQDLQLERHESRDLLARALEKLPREFRVAVVLSFLRELSLEEIALIENCSLGTVKSRIHRGKLRLRTLMEVRS